MKTLWIAAVGLTLVWIGSPAGEVKSKPRVFVDRDYVLALSAANRFLSAWQMRHRDEGLALVSPKLKKKRSVDDLSLYIVGLSNPHHEAFEIGSGKRLADRQFAFEVRLYEHYTGTKWRRALPKPSRIIVIKTDPEDWLVDKLP